MKRIAFAIAVIALCPNSANAQTTSPLTLLRTIPLPGVTGKFDHFGIDLAGRRLFAAATGNHSVEVISLQSGKVEQSIGGLGKPHGLAWVDATHTLYVADGVLGELRAYRGSPLKPEGALKLSDDADDMVYDGARGLLYVGHGGSGAAAPARIAAVDTATLSLVADLSVASHPEALDLDARGRRIFANIADSNEIAVIDGAANTIVAHWKLSGAADNVPMAYDAVRQRLYVACRTPAMLIALNATTGAELARAPVGDGADDLFYDAELGRVYVISGAGEIDTFTLDGDAHVASIGVTHTVAGAKTALFVPSESTIYLGVPGRGELPAAIRVYSTAIQKESQ